MESVRQTIERYAPIGEQEISDRRLMLRSMEVFDDLLLRSNELAHFTASSWIVSPDHDQVLMVYHNIYDSWSWTGGHADGDGDLRAVAIREAMEETGLDSVRLVQETPISLEVLPVPAHVKRGKFVSAHLHFNLTYLLEASPYSEIREKTDENHGVRWFGLNEAIDASTEKDMRVIYGKLNDRVRRFK